MTQSFGFTVGDVVPAAVGVLAVELSAVVVGLAVSVLLLEVVVVVEFVVLVLLAGFVDPEVVVVVVVEFYAVPLSFLSELTSRYLPS